MGPVLRNVLPGRCPEPERKKFVNCEVSSIIALVISGFSIKGDS